MFGLGAKPRLQHSPTPKPAISLATNMSFSDALGPYPIIRHFYPIDPETACQQQSAVYNEPNFPLVAPIFPVPVQQPRESRGNILKKNILSMLKSNAEASISDTVSFCPLVTRPSD